MNRSLSKMLCGIVMIGASVLAHAPSASAAGQPYVWWCWAAPVDSPSLKMFFSSVFASDARDLDIKSAYGKYVRETYPNDNPGPGECNWSTTRDQARTKLDTAKANARYNNQGIVDTGWTYAQ